MVNVYQKKVLVFAVYAAEIMMKNGVSSLMVAGAIAVGLLVVGSLIKMIQTFSAASR